MLMCEIEITKTKKNSSLHWSESVLKKLAEDETAHQIHVAIRFDLYYLSYMSYASCYIIRLTCFVSHYITSHHITRLSLVHLVLEIISSFLRILKNMLSPLIITKFLNLETKKRSPGGNSIKKKKEI
jgi:hypothetical protein